MSNYQFKRYRYTPPHLFLDGAVYMITASIYGKKPLMKSKARKEHWISAFIKSAELYEWVSIAWVVLDDHYHTVIRPPKDKATSLPKFIASYHKFTAREWNQLDQVVSRRVWWNYWDTCIKTRSEFENCLNYLFWNPVKHGLVEEPDEYPFSSFNIE